LEQKEQGTDAIMPEVVSLCKTPKDAYMGMAEKGAELCEKGALKVFHQAFYAGCYIGFGGQLSMNIAGGIAHMAKDDPGISTFVFAALFPVNLLIILLTGGVLITGVSAIVPCAVLEGKAHWTNIPKYFAISWLGNLCGSLVFAVGIQYIDLNLDVADIAFDLNADSVKYSSAELCGKLAKKVAEKKVAKDFFQTFVKGIGCNWMVCMAVFLSGQAQDMTGKMVGIWFPISCFVAIGFEHIPANMYMIPLGMLAGADVTVWEVIWKNFIPTTLGNIFAGSIIVACGYSYSFGALGKPKELQKSPDASSTKVPEGKDDMFDFAQGA
jgi:formate/nitrite transporter